MTGNESMTSHTEESDRSIKEPALSGSLEMLRILSREGISGKGIAPDTADPADPFLLNGASLAYIGDAVYELLVRSYMLDHGSHMADKLHRRTVELVNAGAQSDMVRALLPELTETETAIFKRGRNASTMTAAKHQSVTDYRRATGLEALFGYLYLNGEYERLLELFRHGAGMLLI